MRPLLRGATSALVAALFASGGVNAATQCREAVTVLPFEVLAADRTAAAAAEASVRTELEDLNRGCVERREDTVKRLKAAGNRIPSCADDLCRTQWVKTLQTRWVLHGVVIGAGGRTSVALSLWGEQGESGRQVAGEEEATVPVDRNASPSPPAAAAPSQPAGPAIAARGGSAPEARTSQTAVSNEAPSPPSRPLGNLVPAPAVSGSHADPVGSSLPLQRAIRSLWNGRTPRPRAGPDLGVLPQVAIGAGAAALVGGMVMGLQAQRTSAALSRGDAGCPPDGFSACFERRLAEGRNQALWSNILYGAGGALAAGGAVLLVWTLP